MNYTEQRDLRNNLQANYTPYVRSTLPIYPLTALGSWTGNPGMVSNPGTVYETHAGSSMSQALFTSW